MSTLSEIPLDAESALSSRCRPVCTPGRSPGHGGATMVLPMFGPSSPSSPSGGTMILPRALTPSFKVGPSRAHSTMRQASPQQRSRPSPLSMMGDSEGFWPPTPMSASKSSGYGNSRTTSPPRTSPLGTPPPGSFIAGTPQRNSECSASPSSIVPTSTPRRNQTASYSCLTCGKPGFADAQSAARHCLSRLSQISMNGGSFQLPASNVSHGYMASRGAGGSMTLHASTEVSFRCPICGQGQFQDAESAAMHCRGAEVSPRTTRDVQEESPGDAFAHQSPSVRSTTSYACPVCKEKGFPDARSAAEHCWQTMGTSSFSPPIRRTQASGIDQTAPRPSSGSPTRNRRPWTRTPPSLDHLRLNSTRHTIDCSGGRALDGVCRTLSMPSKRSSEGDCLVSAGQHILSPSSRRCLRKIERHVDEDTGIAQTIVHNEDGTCIAFGESSVCSLVESEEIEAKKLIDSLNDLELQGLVHELNQRLLKTAGDYEALQKELDAFEELCDLAFFGLDQYSLEKELDQAYRKMARKLHPDKNGNTDEAKRRFQDMKDRYERLKKKYKSKELPRRREERPEAKVPEKQELDAATIGEFSPNCEVPDTLPTEPIELPDAGNLNSMDQGGNGAEQEEVDRDKLDDACWRILRRTKAFYEKTKRIHQQIEDTKEELEHLRKGDHLP